MAETAVHQFPLRIYYEDTDAGGIVYYANYLRFAERARSEMLRAAGIESARLMAEDRVALAVRRCAVDYLKPARLDDEVVVETEVVKVGGASLDARQVVRRGGEALVRMELKLGCMSLDGGVARMPAELRRRLRDFVDGETTRAIQG
ncbi:MAG: tol-pal system-associated acyl-CoA thioesterase [Magnetovibrio sp.]|nr:tol-pal system-associated acyl-CoA thioesterase [Magnetovibrio sp.]